ncbi:uncharacterized protein [Vulpes vulpes]|uniref:Translation initiation factor IF-2-like n=1 Tax=Vulpes vulpes TaxID=9627 RepID=A0A3Q7S553_VULVU
MSGHLPMHQAPHSEKSILARAIPGSPPQRGSIKITDVEAQGPAPGAGWAPGGRWWTRNPRASASSSGTPGPATSCDPRRAARRAGYPGERAGQLPRGAERARRAGAQASRRRGRRGSGYCTFPPGPARSVPTRATERACAASCRAASTPGPAAAASSATEPAVTQAAKTALKGGGGGNGGGGGGGGGCASALPVPRDPPSDQRRPGEAKKGAAPCWYSLFLSVGQGLLAAGTLMHSSFCCIERTTEAKEGV